MNNSSEGQPWRISTELSIKRANEKTGFFIPQKGIIIMKNDVRL
jgi:hypothetical protein